MAMTYNMEAFAQGLVDHGLIIPSDQTGVFGRGSQFERVIDALGDHFNRMGVQDGADRINHPPVVSRKLLERVNYLESFPTCVARSTASWATACRPCVWQKTRARVSPGAS